MNHEQLTAGVRSLVAYALAFAAGKGWIATDDVLQLAPLIGSALLLAYGIWKRRDLGLAQAAGQVPGVVVGTDTTASPALKAAAADKTTPANSGIVPIQEIKT